MSTSLSIKAYADKENKEFQKHYEVVEFCIKKNVSFPKETSEFFNGKIDGGKLEDYNRDYILEKIKDGIEVPLNIVRDEPFGARRIKVSDIPREASVIVIEIV